MHRIEGFEGRQSRVPTPARSVLSEQISQALWASRPSFMPWKLWPTFQVWDWDCEQTLAGGARKHGSFPPPPPHTHTHRGEGLVLPGEWSYSIYLMRGSRTHVPYTKSNSNRIRIHVLKTRVITINEVKNMYERVFIYVFPKTE